MHGAHFSLQCYPERPDDPDHKKIQHQIHLNHHSLGLKMIQLICKIGESTKIVHGVQRF